MLYTFAPGVQGAVCLLRGTARTGSKVSFTFSETKMVVFGEGSGHQFFFKIYSGLGLLQEPPDHDDGELDRVPV